jgi:hypothetical protein
MPCGGDSQPLILFRHGSIQAVFGLRVLPETRFECVKFGPGYVRYFESYRYRPQEQVQS